MKGTMHGPAARAAALAAALLFVCAGCATGEPAGNEAAVHAEPFVFEGWGSQTPAFLTGQGIQGMDSVARDGERELLLNAESLDFALVDHGVDQTWFSSPLCDPSYEGPTDDEYRALLGLTVNRNGTLRQYNAFAHCVRDGNFAVRDVPGGVAVDMAVGENKEITSDDLPQAVEKERFETKILAPLDSAGKAELNKRYTLYAVGDESIPERIMNTMLERFPVLADRDLYILNNAVPDFAAAAVKGYLDGIGYDAEDIQQDNDDNGADIQVTETVRFDLTLTLTLSGGRLQASVDCSRLRDYDSAVLTDISLLEVFGASFDPADEGFLLLPDGSGAIQNINGEASGFPATTVRLYGADKAVRSEQRYAAVEQGILPVFALKNGADGFVAIVDRGAAIASVTTRLRGLVPYSSVYAFFTVNEVAAIDAGLEENVTSGKIEILQADPYRDAFTVNYMFAAGDDADLYGFSGIARRYWQEQGLLPSGGAAGQRPLNVEMIGSVDKDDTLLGIIPVRKNMAATTFEQAGDIVDALHAAGVGRIAVDYLGWCNGGLYTAHLQKLTVESALGGKKGLSALAGRLEANGDALYPRVELLSVANMKGLSANKMAARAPGNNLTTRYQYDAATGNRYDYRIGAYLAPARLTEYIRDFADGYASLGIAGLSVADAARDLHSDRNKADPMNRQKAGDLVADSLAVFADADLRVETGNLYALEHAGYITGIPVDSSRYLREMYAVPFVQMVLRGATGYASAPANDSSDMEAHVLRSVAFGADLSFRFSWQPSDFFEGTYYRDSFSTDYRDWLEPVAELYKRAYALLDRVAGQDITGYERVADGVFKTTYADGTAVVANYTGSAVRADGETVESMDFIVLGGGV